MWSVWSGLFLPSSSMILRPTRALGLATVFLADLFVLAGLEPVLELLAAHVDGLAELLYDLLVAPCHTTYALLRASGLWAASLPLFSLSTR